MNTRRHDFCKGALGLVLSISFVLSLLFWPNFVDEYFNGKLALGLGVSMLLFLASMMYLYDAVRRRLPSE
jgi:polyferredoxin